MILLSGKRKIFSIQSHWVDSSSRTSWHREVQGTCVWTSESFVPHEGPWAQVRTQFHCLCKIWEKYCNTCKPCQHGCKKCCDWKKKNCHLKSLNHEKWDLMDLRVEVTFTCSFTNLKFFPEKFNYQSFLQWCIPKKYKQFPVFLGISSQLHLCREHQRSLQYSYRYITNTHLKT